MATKFYDVVKNEIVSVSNKVEAGFQDLRNIIHKQAMEQQKTNSTFISRNEFAEHEKATETTRIDLEKRINQSFEEMARKDDINRVIATIEKLQSSFEDFKPKVAYKDEVISKNAADIVHTGLANEIGSLKQDINGLRQDVVGLRAEIANHSSGSLKTYASWIFSILLALMNGLVLYLAKRG